MSNQKKSQIFSLFLLSIILLQSNLSSQNTTQSNFEPFASSTFDFINYSPELTSIYYGSRYLSTNMVDSDLFNQKSYIEESMGYSPISSSFNDQTYVNNGDWDVYDVSDVNQSGNFYLYHVASSAPPELYYAKPKTTASDPISLVHVLPCLMDDPDNFDTPTMQEGGFLETITFSLYWKLNCFSSFTSSDYFDIICEGTYDNERSTYTDTTTHDNIQYISVDTGSYIDYTFTINQHVQPDDYFTLSFANYESGVRITAFSFEFDCRQETINGFNQDNLWEFPSGKNYSNAYTDGEFTDSDLNIAPYQSTEITDSDSAGDSYFYYIVKDIDNNIIKFTHAYQEGDDYLYVAPTSEACQITLTNQNGTNLDMDLVRVEINLGSAGYQIISSPSFNAPKDSTVSYRAKSLLTGKILDSDSDTVVKGINSFNLQIDVLYVSNNGPDPIIFNGCNYSNEFVYPYQTNLYFDYTTGNYNFSDQYEIFLEQDTLVGNKIVYNPPIMEACMLWIRDQNNEPLDFDLFKVVIDGIQITTSTFYAERNDEIAIWIGSFADEQYDLSYYTVQSQTNYIYRTINTLYLQNNANEPINVSLIENGHYQSSIGLSWDLDTPNTQPSNLQYSDDSLMYLENEYQDHNKVMYSETKDYQSAYNYKTQFGEAKEGVQQWNSSVYDYKKNPYTNEDMGGIIQWNESDISETSFNHGNIDWEIVDYQNHKNAVNYSHIIADSSYDMIQKYDTQTNVFTFEMYFAIGYKQILYMATPTNTLGYLSFDTYNFFSDVGSTGWTSYTNRDDYELSHYKMIYDGTGIIKHYINGELMYEEDCWDSSQLYLYLALWQESGSTTPRTTIDAVGITTIDSYVVGSNRYYWNFTDTTVGQNNYVDVVEEWDGHKDVMKLNNVDSLTTTLRQQNTESYERGTLTYNIWLQNTNYMYPQIYQDLTSNVRINMNFHGGYLYNYLDSEGDQLIGSTSIREWHEITIDFDCFTDTYDCYIDGEFMGNFDFYTGGSSIGHVRFYIPSWDIGQCYIDSLGINSNLKKDTFFIPDGGFGKTFNETYYSGSFEWWQNNAINSSTLYLGNTTLQFSDTTLSIGHPSNLETIENANQLTNRWNHYQLIFNNSGTFLYRNESFLYSNSYPLVVSQFRFIGEWNSQFRIDAIDYNFSNPNYVENQNMQLNTSSDLWCWEVFPNWELGYYQGLSSFDSEDELIGYQMSEVELNQTILSEYQNHKNVLNLRYSNTETSPYQSAYNYMFDDGIPDEIVNSINIEFYVGIELSNNYMVLRGTGNIGYLLFTTSYCVLYSYSTGLTTSGIANDFTSLTHVRLELSTEYLSLWINGVYKITIAISTNDFDYLTYGAEGVKTTSTYYDAFDYSLAEGYFIGRNLLENTTSSPLPINYNISQIVYPYQESIALDYQQANYIGQISDLYGNSLESISLENSTQDNHIIYTPIETRDCFISITDQKSEYIDWEKFHIYVNGTGLYSNIFSREIGTTWNITMYDKYNILITSQLYTVARENNFIDIQINQYSLKIFNQQEVFNYVNITRDPNYYDSSDEWTEWIAPMEIIDFKLMAGYYKVAIESNEDSIDLEYAYTLSGDDILLLTSQNTLSNAITSILNVNTTIGNQITAVNISIVNTQTDIENQIVSVEINLDNINSTLGDQLISLSSQINNLNSDITSLFSFTNTSLINLNSSMDTQFLSVNTNIANYNDSISTLVIGVDNSIQFMNSSIQTSLTQISNNLILVNASLNTALFDLDTTINEIDSEITANYVLLNNSLNLVNTNINSSQIAILNQLMIINNTIMDSITDLQQSVFLINNSIYTATVDLGTSLTLKDNQILGNLSFFMEVNPELSAIYTNTLFSNYLNWSSDVESVRNQTDFYTLLNNYRNQSLEIQFLYNSEIVSMQIAAQETISQAILNEDVEYRVKDVATGEYLTEWEELPPNKTVKFGDYEEIIPATPSDLVVEENDWFIAVGVWILVGIVGIVAVILVMRKIGKKSRYEIMNIPTSSPI
ncbi:hypothetical protein [Candidatus Lokiarchaeum ossiferum]|uniref:hypothetical protein n=1 Tax=Candidatus Lokiarchaeum ossiferum TaxID=2951803 RepID=UPI00352EF812